MKAIARYLIYITFMIFAVLLIIHPVMMWMEAGEIDTAQILICSFLAFTLIFVGTEANESLKKRWGG